MFQQYMQEKQDFDSRAKYSLQPLEFKLNKERLEKLGISPSNNNVTIVPKYWKN